MPDNAPFVIPSETSLSSISRPMKAFASITPNNDGANGSIGGDSWLLLIARGIADDHPIGCPLGISPSIDPLDIKIIVPVSLVFPDDDGAVGSILH